MLVRSTPKTAGSRRTLPLPTGLVSSLRGHRRAQKVRHLAAGPSWSVAPADEPVLTTARGAPIDPRNASRWFAAHAKALGLEGLKPHGLRHSAASLLVAQGVPLIEVSRLLGHSGLSITADVYSHLAPSALVGAVDVLAATFAKAAK